MINLISWLFNNNDNIQVLFPVYSFSFAVVGLLQRQSDVESVILNMFDIYGLRSGRLHLSWEQ